MISRLEMRGGVCEGVLEERQGGMTLCRFFCSVYLVCAP